MTMAGSLEIKNLHVSVGGKEIIKGLNLEIKTGEVCAIMGPNGSGKSTLANSLMGHPNYVVTKGEILLDGKNISELASHKRASLGLFLGFQYPAEVPGVSVSNFLRVALNALRKAKGEKELSVVEFYDFVKGKMKLLKMDNSFLERYLNEGFSGGEKKKAEILQMAVLDPKFAILDETDSGLDVDALKTVANGINKFKGKENGIVLITHYNRILNYVVPDKIHIMVNGKILKSGGKELAHEIEEKGYDWLMPKLGLNVIH